MNKNNLQTKKSGATEPSGKTLKQKQKVLVVSELKNKRPIQATQNNRFYEDIVETIREPLLVLDSDLRVLYANQRFYTAFKVTVQKTIGNLVYDLGNQQWDIPGLRTLLEEIIPEKNRFDDYQIEHDFPTIGN